jgi:DNA-binding helix-hairpin-helix protein with protein kinase domain
MNPTLNNPTQKIAPDRRLPVTQVVKPGDVLHTEKQQSVMLGPVLGEGGEGAVFKTSTPLVAKIYKPEMTTSHRLAKLQILLRKGLSCPGLCLPKALLYNSKNEFVGYLMEKAEGVKLHNLYIKPLLQKNFPHWQKRDIVELAINILQRIGYLHSKGIVLVDINPDNLLVRTPKEVYFVDCDSYQVDGYPCTVGTIPFTAPELQNRASRNNLLRTIGNENFAIAVLLFSLMVTGQMPYNQKGGDTSQRNIISMDFSYPLGEKSNKKTPNGPWRFLWSHLPKYLKEAFYETFSKGGKYSTESSRLGAIEWYKKLNHYLNLLDTGKLGEQDKMSEVLYPTRFKKQKGVTYVTCPRCNEDTDESHFSKEGICMECQRKIWLSRQLGKRTSRTPMRRTIQSKSCSFFNCLFH